MKTTHEFICGWSNNLDKVSDKSVSLIITSPPYPMIDMWDDCFSQQDSSIDIYRDPQAAFEKMHLLLNQVWDECDRILIDGGFICINIGDATRTINDTFQMFSNHSKIISYFQSLGYSVLPDIIWRKQSNSPNKFMGSGMYPAGAYVTYEHEYILIFRKGGKRMFTSASEKEMRRESAYFWEERNVWFSDLWDFKGTHQSLNLKGVRNRSAAYPFELAYRLINMYSIKGDTVCDPFSGTGTTNLAAMASERNSIGIDCLPELSRYGFERCRESIDYLNQYIYERIESHFKFIETLPDEKYEKCYVNMYHNFRVKTRQEMKLKLSSIDSVIFDDMEHIITVSSSPIEVSQ